MLLTQPEENASLQSGRVYGTWIHVSFIRYGTANRSSMAIALGARARKLTQNETASMNSLIHLQNRIFRMIAIGETLERTAACLCLEFEKLVPGLICSIFTADANERFHLLSGPSLPAGFSSAFEDLQSGLTDGSCRIAADLCAPTVAPDFESDERHFVFKHFAPLLGLHACSSRRILNDQGILVGALAFYSSNCRGLSTFENYITSHCLHLCLVAIESHQRTVEAQRHAFTDVSTGLPNRAAFDSALASLPCETSGTWAVFIVDLDNLKFVNSILGHETGDCLLQCAGRRISDAVYPNLTFRIGGDEFAIILRSAEKLNDLTRTAEQVIEALVKPVMCKGHEVIPRATIGGATLSSNDQAANDVRQNAEFALYYAKETGRGGFAHYRPGIGNRINHQLNAIRDLDDALRENRIEAYYQPIVRLDTREIVGLEALCRMRVGKEILSAAAFHEATTNTHVAADLTARMMALVATDIRMWLDMGIPFQHVGINVSSADMHGKVDQILEKTFKALAVPLKHVILEVTESVYMGHGDLLVQNAIAALRAKGLRIALDDFGTGFASLTHLLTVPVDIIKIDKSFVDRLTPDDVSATIIQGLINIAAKLNIRVVVEGIELEDQVEVLQSVGCQLGQGYLFSRPIDREATTALLLSRAQY